MLLRVTEMPRKPSRHGDKLIIKQLCHKWAEILKIRFTPPSLCKQSRYLMLTSHPTRLQLADFNARGSHSRRETRRFEGSASLLRICSFVCCLLSELILINMPLKFVTETTALLFGNHAAKIVPQTHHTISKCQLHCESTHKNC